MSAIILLIFLGILVAGGFLAAFIWAVRSGQYDDDYSPSVRMLYNSSSEKTDLVEKKEVQDVEHEAEQDVEQKAGLKDELESEKEAEHGDENMDEQNAGQGRKNKADTRLKNYATPEAEAILGKRLSTNRNSTPGNSSR